MGVYLAIPAGLLTAVLQSSLMPHLRIAGATPNLVLVVLVLWVLLVRTQEGLVFAFAAGMTLDTLSSAPFGTAIVGLALATLLSGLGAANVFGSAWYLPYVTVAAATLCYGVVQVISVQAGGRLAPFGASLRYVILPELVANLVLIGLFWGVVSVVQRYRRRHEVRST